MARQEPPAASATGRDQAVTLGPPAAVVARTHGGNAMNLKAKSLALSVTALASLATLAPAAGATNGPRACGSKQKVEVVGLTADQRLICFRDNRPGRAKDLGAVSGLIDDTSLVGIDYRPANDMLYGLGNRGGIYTLDPASAEAKLVSRSSEPLSGTSFGVDFNPVADRLRVVSDNGQNLRINVVDGLANKDTPVNYTPGTPTAGVVAAAYTNSDDDPNTATTLFDIDSALDQVVVQSPPNAGTLVATGKLGVDVTDATADIATRIRRGVVTNTGYAAVTADGRSQFTRLDPLSGQAQVVGSFDADDKVIGIAVPTDQG
jgi:hypothetical protein